MRERMQRALQERRRRRQQRGGARGLRLVRWIWRMPEAGLPDALRLRRLSRWLAWRLTWALLLGAVVGGVPAGLGWLGWLVPVPLLLDLTLWRVAPLPLRLAVRSAELSEEIQGLNAQLSGWGPELVFDPELGWAGLPVPELADPAPAEYGERYELQPLRPLAIEDGGRVRLPAEQEGWIRYGRVRWTGRTLVLVDGRSRLVEIPLTDADAPTQLPGRPAELVLLRERRLGTGFGHEVHVLLLDATGHRLLTMPGSGLDVTRLRELAAAARLSFSQHTLWVPAELPGFGLISRLFPARRGHVHLYSGVIPSAGPTTGPTGLGLDPGDAERLTR